MGLAPSRQQYTGTPAGAAGAVGDGRDTLAGAPHASHKATARAATTEALLPFISRAPDGYTYEEDTSTPTATAAAAAAGAGDDDTTADGASRGPAKKSGKGKQAEAEESSEVLYYYEHRLVPLTSDFFPSESSVLFGQLYAARAAQNARYHFQSSQGWSPGSLLDPTAHYQSLDVLADVACAELRETLEKVAAARTAGDEGSAGKAQDDSRTTTTTTPTNNKTAARQASPPHASLGSTNGADDLDVPFASRATMYDLLVRLFEAKGLLHWDNAALREACLAALPDVTPSSGKAATKATFAPSKAAPSLRPLPCAIALVRVPVTKAVYRDIYYKAGFQRHHHMSKANATGGSEAAASIQKKMAQALENLKLIQVTAQDVMRAVHAHDLNDANHAGSQSNGTSGAPHTTSVTTADASQWLSVKAPHESAETPVEMRIVGMFGCWTVEEILRYSLFVRAPSGTSVATHGKSKELRTLGPLPASAEALLARARPHGVPSSTLLNVTFFEKQVGDKEQCHTYFALMRYFARGLRDCIMQEESALTRPSTTASTSGTTTVGTTTTTTTTNSATAASTPFAGIGTTAGGKGAASKGTASSSAAAAATSTSATTTSTEPPSSTQKALSNIQPLDDDPKSTWSRFIHHLITAAEHAITTTTTTAASTAATKGAAKTALSLPDWSTALLVRFSNVPQLQLCRQVRLLVHELVELYPEPPTLLALQDSQRLRSAKLSGMKSNTAAATVPETTGSTASTPATTAAKGAKSKKPHPLNTLLSDSTSTTTTTTAKISHESPTPDQLLSRVPRKTSQRTSGNHDLGGLACYIQDGLVVMRLSHLQAARAVRQLARMPLEDSVEALAVTLTAPAPPPLTYRGELRAPRPLTLGDISQWCPPVPVHCPSLSQSREPSGRADAWSPPSPTRQNACRYVLDEAAGYPLHVPMTPPYMPSRAVSPVDPWAEPDPMCGEAAPLPQPPRLSLLALHDEEIGVQPPTHAGLLPCPGWRPSSSSSLTSPTSAATTVVDAALSEPHWMNLFAPFPYACKFPEVYVVPRALDGTPFRALLELSQQTATLAFEASGLSGATAAHGGASSPLVRPVPGASYPHPFLSILPGAVRRASTGSTTLLGSGPDSVLLSPLSVPELPSLPSVTTTNAALSPEPQALTQTHSAASATMSSEDAAQISGHTPTLPRQWFDHVVLSEPDRILHTGDVIRCDPSTAPSSPLAGAKGTKLTKAPSPKSNMSTPTAASTTTTATTATTTTMRWYVDEELRTEDIILSWMRRLGSRARETRPMENKWVRYPPLLFQKLLWTEIRYGRPWLLFDNTNNLRFPLASCKGLPALGLIQHAPPASTLQETIPQDGVLISLLDIVKDRRFRQWEFALSGFAYFHGVSVRLPGTTVLPTGVIASSQTLEEAQNTAREEEKPAGPVKKGKHKDPTGSGTGTGAAAPTPPPPFSSARVDPNTTCLRLFRLSDGTVAAVSVDDWMHEGMRDDEVDPPIPVELPSTPPAPPPRRVAATAVVAAAPAPVPDTSRRPSAELHRPPPLDGPRFRPAGAAIPSPPTRALPRPGPVSGSAGSNSGSRAHTPLYSPYPYPGQETTGGGAWPVSSLRYPSRVTGGGGGSSYMGYAMGGAVPAQADPMMTYGGSYYYYNGNYGEAPSPYVQSSTGGGGGGSFPRYHADSYANVEFASTGLAMDRLDSSSFPTEAMTPMSSVAGADPARVTGSFFNDFASSSYSAGHAASYGGGSGMGPEGVESGTPFCYYTIAQGAPRTPHQQQPQQQQSRYPVTGQMTAMMPQVLQAPAHNLVRSSVGLQHHVWREPHASADGSSGHGSPMMPSQYPPSPSTQPQQPSSSSSSRTGTTVNIRVMARTRAGQASSANASANNSVSTSRGAATNQGHEPRRHGRSPPPLPQTHSGRGDVLLYTESSADNRSHDLYLGETGETATSMTGVAAQPSGSELTYTGNSSAYGAIGLSRGGLEERPEEEDDDITTTNSHSNNHHHSHNDNHVAAGPAATADSARGAPAASKRTASRGSNHGGGLGSQSRGSWRSHNPYAYSSSNNNLLGNDIPSVASSSSLRSPTTSFHNSYHHAPGSHGQIPLQQAGSAVGGDGNLYGNGSGADLTGSLYKTNADEGFTGGAASGGLYGSPYGYGGGEGGAGGADGASQGYGFAESYGPPPMPAADAAAPYYYSPHSTTSSMPPPSSSLSSGMRPSSTYNDPQTLRGGSSGPFYMTSPLPQSVGVPSALSTPHTSSIAGTAPRAASGGSVNGIVNGHTQESGGSGTAGGGGRQTVVTFCSTGDSAMPSFAQTTPRPAPSADARAQPLRAEYVHNYALHATENSARAVASSDGDRNSSSSDGAFRIPNSVVSGGPSTSAAAQGTLKSSASSVPVPAAPTQNTFLKKKKK